MKILQHTPCTVILMQWLFHHWWLCNGCSFKGKQLHLLESMLFFGERINQYCNDILWVLPYTFFEACGSHSTVHDTSLLGCYVKLLVFWWSVVIQT